MRGLVLFIVAVLLSLVCLPVGLVYGFFRLWVKADFRQWFSKFGKYLFVIAVSIDQLGNVIMQELFDDLLIKPYGYKFGNEDETISSVIGKNKLMNTLTRAGKLLDWILNIFEKDHSVKNIENK